jgi:hypothetical protein
MPKSPERHGGRKKSHHARGVFDSRGFEHNDVP